ncbi:MAG: hypothetical protein KJZ59_10510 [Pararhodobacter sp.]|nr:hypothetical protein [Pararhodobacter sp.]
MTQDEPTRSAADAAPQTRARRVQSVKGTKGDTAREMRIKAALKANIARRKAQARARDEDEHTHD